MPIKILIETKNDAFPDTGNADQYLAAVAPVMKQVENAVKEFATHRIDRVTPLTDAAGQPCGSVEILRF